MSSDRRYWTWIITGCALVTACGSSPPIRYFALNSVTPASAQQDSTAVAPLRLEPVTIPAELDRLELVSHTGPNSVRIADSERWAAPLDEQIRAVLSEDLSKRMGPNAVADPNEPTTEDPRRLLTVAFSQLDVDATTCAVDLRADWTLRVVNQPGRSDSEQVQLREGAACSDAGAATAISQALGMLADQLAGKFATSKQ